ncbi:Gfo/Idh/MocA family oxidoreductase [Desulfopila sp. IMCC35006]|nr:Gfo/Idh/MocA family oxidoreductase [Desulfopila sp. IMCC35006]
MTPGTRHQGRRMIKNDPLRVGIIGTGKHGSRYANHIVKDLGHCFQLAAISRRSAAAKEQAAAWNTRLFADWRELVSSPLVDAVICVTTPNLNPEIARFCAAQNKPLLLEKPLTTDFHTAKELVALFERKSLPLTIGQTLRYNSVICALRDMLPSMGRVFSLGASQRLEPSTLSWLEQPEIAGAGVIFHTAVHLFDALRFITGQEIVRIRATARNIYNPRLEDVVTAEVLMADGALGTIDTSKVSPSRACRYEFVCEKGQLHGDQVHGLLQKIVGMDISHLPVPPPGPAILPLLEDWYAYLQGDIDNPIPGAEGLAAVKICHACRKSVATDQWVTIDEL